MRIEFEKRQAMARLLLRNYDFTKETMDIKLTDIEKQYFQDIIDDMKDEIKSLIGTETNNNMADLRYNVSVFKKALKAGS